MNLKLSEWASVAEVVSSVAVVVTLLFLIFGIRDNTEITKASVYESNINSLMQWRGEISHDRELAEVYQAYTDGTYDTLDPVDYFRMIQMAANGMNVYEKAYYFAREYDVMGESEYSRFERMACLQYGRASQSEEILATMNLIMTEQFMAYLKDVCAESQ